MNIRTIIILLISLVLANSISAKTNVKISLPGLQNKVATVWTYKDLISLEREIITQEPVSNNGDLSFTVYNKNVQKYYVEVRYFRISFLLETNKDYTIDLEEIDLNNRNFYPKNVVGYLSPKFNIKIKGNPKNELNKELDSLNIIFDNFIDKNHLALRLGNQSWKLIDSLQADCKNYLSHHPNPYLAGIVEIQLAQFRKLSKQYGDDYIIATYFTKDKIQYNNPAFMSYFSSFWTKYIPSRLRHNVAKRLDSVINIEQSYQALSALLSEDPLLADPNLRELVVLRNISQLHKQGINNKAIINILFDISASKTNPKHREIAINLRRKLENNEAPKLSLINSKGDTINLNTEKDKYIYIQIFNDECIECLAQMKYTTELIEEFDDIITFVHISVDRSSEDMEKIIKDQEFNWNFVFLEDNYQFIYDYNISVVPQAILIDKDGSIIDNNAILPSDYFKDTFLKMLNDRKGNLKQQDHISDGIRKSK